MRRLVLVGAGHAHALVLLALAQRPLVNVDVVLVSPESQAPYSGMVPGWLAGHYRWQECCIDFAHLCKRARVRLCSDAAVAVEPECNILALASGERLAYDWLSLNIGATLLPPAARDLEVLAMRPLAALRQRWEALHHRVRGRSAGASFRVVAAGGGAAGVESLLSAQAQLAQWAPRVRFQYTLALRDKEIVPGLAHGAARRLHAHLSQRGVALSRCFDAERFEGDAVVSSTGEALHADAVLWATGAQAFAWPAASELATDARGFVRVDAALRSVSHPNVFAAGDCASRDPPLPKAGVYAVRMGPVLAHNLRAAAEGRPLRPYVPQRRFLVLVGTGDANAVASWGPLAWQGAWVWRWKQRIDRRFVTRFNTL